MQAVQQVGQRKPPQPKEDRTKSVTGGGHDELRTCRTDLWYGAIERIPCSHQHKLVVIKMLKTDLRRQTPELGGSIAQGTV
jgi:hypothetical protein